MFNSNNNTVLSVDDNTVLSVYFNPSKRQDAKSTTGSALYGNCAEKRETTKTNEFWDGE